MHPHRLPTVLALSWGVLILYASLYPLTGWRDSGAPLLDFLFAGWPRWFTFFDLLTNVLAYLPLGFLGVSALAPTLGWGWAVVLATLGGVGLSLGVELAQNFLPSRIPSNVDLAMNALGVLAGALAGARWGALLLDGSRLAFRRARHVAPGGWGDAGLLLAGLWLLTQFDPTTLLFGNGDLRRWLALPSAFAFSTGRAPWLEGAAVGAHTLAVALLLAQLLRRRRWLPILGLLLVALAGKSLATYVMMQERLAFAWATPGSLGGLAIGLMLWFALRPLRAHLQRALAGVALIAAIVLVNVAPENPYFAHTLQVWHPGQFLNFHGLTRLAALVWPYLALTWLLCAPTEKGSCFNLRPDE